MNYLENYNNLVFTISILPINIQKNLKELNSKVALSSYFIIKIVIHIIGIGIDSQHLNYLKFICVCVCRNTKANKRLNRKNARPYFQRLNTKNQRRVSASTNNKTKNYYAYYIYRRLQSLLKLFILLPYIYNSIDYIIIFFKEYIKQGAEKNVNKSGACVYTTT